MKSKLISFFFRSSQVEVFLNTVAAAKVSEIFNTYATKYSRMDQVKFVEDSL